MFHHFIKIWYHILPVNRINNSLQYSATIRNRELIRLTHTSTELMFEVTVKLSGLYPHPFPMSTQVKHWTFPSTFVVSSLQVTSFDEPPFDHKCGIITFYNPASGVKYKPLYETYDFFPVKALIVFSVKLNFSLLQIGGAIISEHFFSILSFFDHSTPWNSIRLFSRIQFDTI